MSNYKVGDKVVLTVTSKVEEPSYSYYILNNDAVLLETTMNEDVKPLSTYTEALEDKINRQAKEITRLLAKNKELKLKKEYEESKEINLDIRRLVKLLAENERLKDENEKMSAKIDAYELYGDQNEEEYNQTFNQGAETAWELAKKGMLMSSTDREAIFGSGCNAMYGVLVYHTYQEAAAKVAEWEKAKEEIKVGDVLEDIYDSNVKCIVTNLYPNNMVYLVFYDGTAGMDVLDNFKKTGRHIDIDGFLKQISGEKK